jgi:hypothetical protein
MLTDTSIFGYMGILTAAVKMEKKIFWVYQRNQKLSFIGFD